VKVQEKFRIFWKYLKKAIYIVFFEESIEGWIAFIFFLVIVYKFLIPALARIFLHTDFPLFVVVTGSMQHTGKAIEYTYYEFFSKLGLDPKKLPFSNGINKGDIVVIQGVNPKEIKVGDVIVLVPYGRKAPLLHRVIKVYCNKKCFFTTKGDANPFPLNFKGSWINISEVNVTEDRIKGKAVFRIPYLGYPEAILVELFYKVVFGTKPYPW